MGYLFDQRFSFLVVEAIENGFGIIPSQQTKTLRLILKHMETLQSHILHLYFLAAPDFLGTGSVIPLITSHQEVVQRAARLKMLAKDGKMRMTDVARMTLKTKEDIFVSNPPLNVCSM